MVCYTRRICQSAERGVTPTDTSARNSNRSFFRPTIRLLAEMPCDLATYRLLLMPGKLWHVVVLGDPLPDELRPRLIESLATGELVSVPNDLLIALNQHRKAQPTINGWAEHHSLLRRKAQE
jgi:hypothetical protein